MSSVSSALGKRVQMLEDRSHVAHVMLLHNLLAIHRKLAMLHCHGAGESLRCKPAFGRRSLAHLRIDAVGKMITTLVIQPEIGHIGRLRLVVLCEIGSSKPRCLAGFHHV